MRIATSFHRLAGFGLLLLLGTGSCTTQEVVAPACVAPACTERVTVRVCLDCAPPFRTTLLLADGYYVLLIGPIWQDYQAQPVDGQVIHVGYQLGPSLGPDQFGLRAATITCLEAGKKSTN